MKKTLTISSVILCGFVWACTPNYKVSYKWVKEGAGWTEFKQDASQCQYEAASNNQPSSPIDALVFGPSVEQQMRQARLEHLCMQAKGWILKEERMQLTRPTGKENLVVSVVKCRNGDLTEYTNEEDCLAGGGQVLKRLQ